MPTIRLPLENKFTKTIRFLDGQRYNHDHGWRDIPKYFRGRYLYGTEATKAELYIGYRQSYTEPRFYVGDCNTLFAFSQELNELLPDNTYVTSIKVNIYLSGGVQYLTSPSNIALSLQKGEPENLNSRGKSYNEKYVSHYFKTGWNEFVFTPDFLDKEAKFRSINICIFNNAIHLDRFNYFNREQYYISESEIRNSVIKFDGFNDANPPYAIVEYAFNPPQNADSMAPNNKVINPRTPIRFTWNTKTEQTGFELQYKVNNSGYKTITKSTADRFYIMDPDTITEKSGTVTWRIRFKDESNTYSEYQVATFELGAPEQEPPRIIYPAGSYIKNTENIEFSWSFVSDTIEKQKSFELQYKIGGTNWQTVKKTTDETTYILSDLQKYGTDTGQWRVKVTNNYGQESDWSEIGKFQLYGVPPIPQIISVSDKNYPTLTWNAEQQEMFRVQVFDNSDSKIYDSDFILDYINKQFKIPKVILDGKYTFKLTIKNKYGIDSEVAQFTKVIQTEDLEVGEIEIYKDDYCVDIRHKDKDFKIIRNGKIIGESKDRVYRDYTGENNRTYQYKGLIIENDIVGYTKAVGGNASFRACTLAPINDLSNMMLLKYFVSEKPKRHYNYDISATEIELEGQKYPFVEYGDVISDETTYSFFIKNRDKIIEFLNKKTEFLLRDYYGQNIIGYIKGVGIERINFGYILSFTMIRTRDNLEQES